MKITYIVQDSCDNDPGDSTASYFVAELISKYARQIE